ncbi:MAG: DamX protein [Cognaticolwellia sp.]|jgi:DamX protein
MSALMKNIALSNDNTRVTKISAHARIDYILRFSKQAILVIDESVEQSAPSASQFLASLPEQHNAAYISLAAQFNNIQVRCRIIEQLYTGELFDPEISLAVSVINLAKKSQHGISIVLDSAQHLSLQIFHELSQLAAIAKKANLVVNIVMCGSVQAGKTVANNKSLFDNKLTLLSAQSGQLLSTTSAIFKSTQPKWQFINQNKGLISALVFLLGLGVLVINLLPLDSFNFAKLTSANKQAEISLTEVLAKPQTMVLAINRENKVEPVTATTIENTKLAARPKDIYSSLINPLSVLPIKMSSLPASPAEVMSAITAESMNSARANGAVLKPSANRRKVQAIIVQNKLVNQVSVNNDYYSNHLGYVIQLAAYSDLTLPKSLLEDLTRIDYQVYQRLLNNKPSVVITSAAYVEKSAAQSALAALPKSLLARQPWIKPVTVINNEINAFLLSQ